MPPSLWSYKTTLAHSMPLGGGIHRISSLFEEPQPGNTLVRVNPTSVCRAVRLWHVSFTLVVPDCFYADPAKPGGFANRIHVTNLPLLL